MDTQMQKIDVLVSEYGNVPVFGPGRTRREVLLDIHGAVQSYRIEITNPWKNAVSAAWTKDGLRAMYEDPVKAVAELLQEAAIAAAPVQAQEPVNSKSEHPSLSVPIDPACSAKLDDLGDDRGQGLDPYWKSAFRAGWKYGQDAIYTATVQPVAVPDGWKLVLDKSKGDWMQVDDTPMRRAFEKRSTKHHNEGCLKRSLSQKQGIPNAYLLFDMNVEWEVWKDACGLFLAAPAAQGDAKDAERWRFMMASVDSEDSQEALLLQKLGNEDFTDDSSESAQMTALIDAAIAAKAGS